MVKKESRKKKKLRNGDFCKKKKFTKWGIYSLNLHKWCFDKVKDLRLQLLVVDLNFFNYKCKMLIVKIKLISFN